ncbi:MAG: hypothetical protein BV458_12380 [Thermoplasmata archaeon M9B2D]|nr:MAG: hypothetical protein BV458_12380 [Thermoplasmata archaeon M9B2D]
MKKKSPYPFKELSPEMQDAVRKGVYCPHCGQFAKAYCRPMGSQIAKFLIRLLRAHKLYGDDRFFTSRELYPKDNKSATDGVLARHWGLIEVADATNTMGAPAGAYKLTDKGRRFVQGVEYIASHAIIYNNELLKLDGRKLIDIRDAIGKKGNYDELMREV